MAVLALNVENFVSLVVKVSLFDPPQGQYYVFF